MEHFMAALFTVGFLSSHAHPQPAALQHQNPPAQVVQQSRAEQLQQEHAQMTAINDWTRKLRGGRIHTPPTVAQRSHLPNS